MGDRRGKRTQECQKVHDTEERHDVKVDLGHQTAVRCVRWAHQGLQLLGLLNIARLLHGLRVRGCRRVVLFDSRLLHLEKGA